MNPEQLMELLFVAANARTPEEKARVVWRASDHLWWSTPQIPIGFCRKFNDLCQNQNLPWIKDLWSHKEAMERLARLGIKFDGSTVQASRDSK